MDIFEEKSEKRVLILSLAETPYTPVTNT
jgi:hypothetical protein